MQKRLIVRGRDHFQRSRLWIGAIHVVAADDDVFQSLLLPLVANVFGEFVIALRARDVGFGGEDAMLAAFFVGSGDGFEFGFDLGLVDGGGGGEAEDGLGGGQVRDDEEESRARVERPAAPERFIRALDFRAKGITGAEALGLFSDANAALKRPLFHANVGGTSHHMTGSKTQSHNDEGDTGALIRSYLAFNIAVNRSGFDSSRTRCGYFSPS